MSKRRKSSGNRDPHGLSGVSVASAPFYTVLVGAALIATAVFLAYLPSINGGFIWDDVLLITENKVIKASDGLYRLWCTTEAVDYWPVTNTTFWLEWRLWGMNSTGYHVTNLILHMVECLLIWLILRKLSIPGAFLAAMIFAVHPVNVESVAWIAQRKNTMAMLFFLLSILWYLKYFMRAPLRVAAKQIPVAAKQTLSTVHRPLSTFSSFILHPSSFAFWYWLSLVAFVLAMLSKGSVAVLPVLLLGIVWWVRTAEGDSPIFADQRSAAVPGKSGQSPWGDVLRLAPFFVVAAALAGVNVWFQTHGTEKVFRDIGFVERLLGAAGTVWFYLYKAFFPIDLTFVYPQWRVAAGNPLWWLPLAAAAVVTAILWAYRKSWSRPFLFAWGFFCAALVPVMGFTDIAFMQYSLVADRYQHVAIIGAIALAAAGWSLWHRRVRGGARRAAMIFAVAAIGFLAILTWRQSGLYRDSITLYQVTLKKNPDCEMAQYNLGNALHKIGRLQEAIEHYKQTIRLKPDYVNAYDNLGKLMFVTGLPEEAINNFQQALRLKPNNAEVHYHLANTLFRIGRTGEAIEHYEAALRIDPKLLDAHNDLGIALAKTGRFKEAIEQFQQALTIKFDDPEAHKNLGLALVETGQTGEAIGHFQEAIKYKPDFIIAYNHLALAYAKLNRSTEAVTTARKALELARLGGHAELARQIEDWLESIQGEAEGIRKK